MKKYAFLSLLVSSFFIMSCEKDSITDELSEINKNDGSKIETLDDAAIIEITAKADAEFIRFNSYGSSLKSANAHWVGVIANSNDCPSGVKEIRYHMDSEDNNPLTSYAYNNASCFKSRGLKIVSSSNLDWVVCIVDANKHYFDNINKGYAIFDLSHETHLRGASEVFIHSDDEDTHNDNRYDSPSYGFAKTNGDGQDPLQAGSYNSQDGHGWTEFWLYYFPAQSTSRKLPKLGFEYSVFSNFVCCNWTNQNIVKFDCEDKKNKTVVKVYPETGSSYNSSLLDATYKVLGKDSKGNLSYYIQNSSVYRETY
jgi:hypothetical protein